MVRNSLIGSDRNIDSTEPLAASPWDAALGRGTLTLFSAFGCFISIAYALQPDWLVPVTMVPAWLWLAPIVLILVLFWRSKLRNRWRLFFGISLLFTILFVEESRTLTLGLLRSQAVTRNQTEKQHTIRVLSFNCAGAAHARLNEILQYDADVILLQESPGNQAVQTLAKTAFGDGGQAIWNGDTSIVVRGKFRILHQQVNKHFVAIEATLASEETLGIVSLRLSPPVFRLDFWTRNFWIEHAATREKHRDQIEEVMVALQQQNADFENQHWIIGGDFNSVAGDGAFSAIKQRGFVESFATAGLGYGATGSNNSPLFRIDQIWYRGLTARSSTARKSKSSDHRIVVADLVIEP